MTTKFTKSHEWLKQDHANEYTVGITTHAQELLGDMVYVELPALGETFQAGDSFGVVESVKAASDVYAPVGGTVTAINDAVKGDPAIINADPENTGWLIKLSVADPAEISTLLTLDEYQQSITEE